MNPLEIFYNNEQAWKNVDHRVDGLFFMSSMWPVNVTIILSFIVFLFGPKYMKSRNPLNIGPIMAVNYIALVTINIYIVFQLWLGSSRKQYGWICSVFDSGATDIEEMRIVRAMHLWFICKLIEMLDFVFLVARKKPIGRKWVVVFHHMAMVWIVWTIVRWIPSGSISGTAIVNCVNHAVVYCYICFIVFLPHLAKTPFLRMAVPFFVMVQLLGCALYCLTIVWVRCPTTWQIVCGFLIISLALAIYYLLIFLNEYQSGSSNRKEIISYSTNVARCQSNWQDTDKCD